MFHLTFLGGSVLNYLDQRYWGGELLKNRPKQRTPEPGDLVEERNIHRSPETQRPETLRGGAPHRLERVFTRTRINQTDWQVPEVYSNLKLVGAGSYGQVCSAAHRDMGETMAIKKLYRPLDSKLHSKRAHRELQLLLHLRSNHCNVIRLFDVFTPNTTEEDFKDIYLVMEFMPTDLHRIIASQELEPPAYQLITYQVLRGLDYIHSAGVLHRDLKPSNIAINEGLVVKILDFGLARIKSSSNNASMTGYVATRWYRAPEVMLHWEHYGNSGKVDVWSVGCILAEMMSREVLFKGGSEMDQIRLMVCLLGVPGKSMMDTIDSAARTFFQSQSQRLPQPLENYFPAADSEVLDLLSGLLKFDPDTRLSARQALHHCYFREIFDREDLVTAPEVKATAVDELDMSCDQWKGQLYKEISDAQVVLSCEAEEKLLQSPR